MSEEDLDDFYKIKDKLINSEALDSPNFSNLDKYPLIMALDFSIKAMCVTIFKSRNVWTDSSGEDYSSVQGGNVLHPDKIGHHIMGSQPRSYGDSPPMHGCSSKRPSWWKLTR